MCPAKCFIVLPKYLMYNSFEIDFSMWFEVGLKIICISS